MRRCRRMRQHNSSNRTLARVSSQYYWLSNELHAAVDTSRVLQRHHQAAQLYSTFPQPLAESGYLSVLLPIHTVAAVSERTLSCSLTVQWLLLE